MKKELLLKILSIFLLLISCTKEDDNSIRLYLVQKEIKFDKVIGNSVQNTYTYSNNLLIKKEVLEITEEYKSNTIYTYEYNDNIINIYVSYKNAPKKLQKKLYLKNNLIEKSIYLSDETSDTTYYNYDANGHLISKYRTDTWDSNGNLTMSKYFDSYNITYDYFPVKLDNRNYGTPYYGKGSKNLVRAMYYELLNDTANDLSIYDTIRYFYTFDEVNRPITKTMKGRFIIDSTLYYY